MPDTVATNCGDWALRVLNFLNCLHELCVTATAAAPTADSDDKWPNYNN